MIPYSVKEGLKGLLRARFSTIASTSAMSVALVLIGLFVIVTIQASSVSTWLRQRVGELELFLTDVDDPVARALHARAGVTPGVVAAEYISREDAEAIFRREFGEEADIFFEEQFLPASIKVQVESDYANPDSLASLAAEFATWNRVDDVVFNQPLLVKVQQNLKLLTLMGLTMGTLVVFASIFLVGNTIRLTIYARRLLIRTMKLVGATDSFVRQPFLVEGMAQGAIAGAAAAMVLSVIYGVLRGYIPQMSEISAGTGFMITFFQLLFGLFLGWAGSLFAVRRFIRSVSLH